MQDEIKIISMAVRNEIYGFHNIGRPRHVRDGLETNPPAEPYEFIVTFLHDGIYRTVTRYLPCVPSLQTTLALLADVTTPLAASPAPASPIASNPIPLPPNMCLLADTETP